MIELRGKKNPTWPSDVRNLGDAALQLGAEVFLSVVETLVSIKSDADKASRMLGESLRFWERSEPGLQSLMKQVYAKNLRGELWEYLYWAIERRVGAVVMKDVTIWNDDQAIQPYLTSNPPNFDFATAEPGFKAPQQVELAECKLDIKNFLPAAKVPTGSASRKLEYMKHVYQTLLPKVKAVTENLIVANKDLQRASSRLTALGYDFLVLKGPNDLLDRLGLG